MKKMFACLLPAACCSMSLLAQTDAGLFRFPDVSKTQIVFTYANDVWVVPKEGGTAIKLSSPAGVESYPKFSPDGKRIAFTGNYDGNKDVYVMPVTGGVPVRITAHSYGDRLVDWTPDGTSIFFASIRESGKYRFNQFYTAPANGGAEQKLPMAYAEFGSYSPDGKQMALNFRSQVGRNWKRYRGGWNADIHIFNFTTLASENISANSDAADEFPMWHDNSIYFLSDRGTEERMNLWRYDIPAKKFEQLTKYTDYDAHYPSMGSDEIVFEQGGKLYLYSFASKQVKEVKVDVITDRTALKPKAESAQRYIQHVNVSPDGNRVIVEARGDIFSVPAKDGFVKNLTSSPGVAERYPAYSPDGKNIAYWSDQSGEYELWMMQPGKENAAAKLTSLDAGYRYQLYWSPDSKKLAFIDKGNKIKIYDITAAQIYDVDKALRWSHGNLEGFCCSWSPDSRWLTYARDIENWHNAVFVYDTKSKKAQQVTSGYYNSNNPVFDEEGKYIYLLTNQSFNPYYSDFDNSFIYANSTQLAAIPLKKDAVSIFAPKNDTVSIKEDETKDEKQADKKDTKKKKDAKDTASDKKSVDKDAVAIDFDGIEQRMLILSPVAGNLGNLNAIKGKIIYMRYPNTGSNDGSPAIKFYDLDKREEKTILDGADYYIMAANKEKLLAAKGSSFAVIAADEGQKFDKPVRTAEMMSIVEPMAEWKQLFTDAWRMERDFFYDPNMHGVNWNLVKERYLKMVEHAMTREEVDFIIGEMIGELNASHTYHGGGDIEKEKSQSCGYLGINWQAEGNFYRIKKILKAAPWDAEVHSSLDVTWLGIREGDYILAVNGVALTTAGEPYAAFLGLSNKPVELTYNNIPSFNNAKTVVVQTMDDEYRLRNLAWIEAMRKRVEEATNGEVGYVYVPSTGVDGQTELLRQLNAQTEKKALIIDERFNDGGQIPDRFIEMLNRTPLAYWAIRDGESWQWPPFANYGPKVMLMNGWSGSGGDAFPDYFRKKGLGPLIGTRTWGGLIGLSGSPDLIDGGSVTVPTFRMYNVDGTWFKEGHGVEPDIEVPEDLTAMAKDTDPQLERAISEIKNLLKTKGYMPPKLPSYEKR
ncbi:PD40 domain-containing protein [Panacibacter sp. DH6]|uniref:Tricorn protease homolog n=1 Tax=Panacibacter microcysteis TaxID=2793269 RepID=A0A931E7P6_9BACT|nr:S41 family peptidase [Panacibacter microcysteis]MBG9376805.1 PD40 domain-containing protein [Panacibacter microcysteis]